MSHIDETRMKYLLCFIQLFITMGVRYEYQSVVNVFVKEKENARLCA